MAGGFFCPKMKQAAPIGIFDSGYGGLTVLKEIQKALPDYDYIYLGDNARAPYGTRSFDVVYQYTLEAVKTLFEKGCHLVILACNTASAKALRTIQQQDLPQLASEKRVLGVIRPSTEAMGAFSQTKHVGVLGTTGTVTSMSYLLELEKLHPDITVAQQACPLWVPLIENDEFDSEGGQYFIQKYVNELMNQDDQIDTIILGCTHYPIIQQSIQHEVGEKVRVFAQGPIVANSLKDYLKRHPEMEGYCSKGGKVEFFTTENPIIFEQKAAVFLQTTVSAQYIEKLG